MSLDCQPLAEELARVMLAAEGIGVIWKLHVGAATLHRIGNRIAADSFIEIAEAAERIAAAQPVAN